MLKRSFTLSEDNVRELRRLAKQLGTNESAIVDVALRYFIEEGVKKKL